MKYSCTILKVPVDELIELAKTAEDVGFDSIALPDSLFYTEKQSTDYPYTPDGSRLWNADTPWVDPLIAAGCDGRGDFDAAVLHQRHEARLPQSTAAGPTGRIGGEPDEQPIRLRCRNRMDPRRIRMVRGALQEARCPCRRDDRRDQTGPRRWHGRVPRRVLRLRQVADEPRAVEAGAVLRRRPHRRGVAARRPRRRRLDQRDDDGRAADADDRQARRAACRIRPHGRAVRIPGGLH